ncbi:MAG: CPBP family intramembrane glutamic endopeptidase [Verrucomicrobiota bacterium]
MPPASAASPFRRPGPLLRIVLYLGAVLLLGAVLAPGLYFSGKWLAGLLVSFKQMETPVLGWIAKKLTLHEFDSYYNRAFLVSALGLLWPFLKWMGLSKNSLGLRKNPLRLADLLTGIIIAGGLLTIMGIALLQAGAFIRKPDANWDSVLTQAFLSAAGASVVEEWVFRGIFLGVALRAAKPWKAIVVVAAFFSILHLVQAPAIDVRDKVQRQALSQMEKQNWTLLATTRANDPAKIDWIIDPEMAQFAPSRINAGSGFAMTTVIFQRNARPALFISEFLTLFAIGLILAVARVRTASLWMPVGLHAGWIFVNTLYMGSTLTTRALRDGKFNLGTGENAIPLIGTQLKIGLVPLGVLVITGLGVGGWLHLRQRKLQAPEFTVPSGDP